MGVTSLWFLASLSLAEPVAPPVIHVRLLPFDEERLELTRAYLQAHHGGPFDGPVDDATRMTPRVIVVHHTGGPTADAAWNTFTSATLSGRRELVGAGALNVSAHFLVDRDGTIWQLMAEDRVGRHVIGLNHVAIGIENVGGTSDAPLTEAQMSADAALIRHLAARHPITHLIGHDEYRRLEGTPLFQELDSTYRTTKVDPGPEFMAGVRTRVTDLDLEGPPPLGAPTE